MDFDELIDGLSSRLGLSPAEVQFTSTCLAICSIRSIRWHAVWR
jgi:hypothetical protein